MRRRCLVAHPDRNLGQERQATVNMQEVLAARAYLKSKLPVRVGE